MEMLPVFGLHWSNRNHPWQEHPELVQYMFSRGPRRGNNLSPLRPSSSCFFIEQYFLILTLVCTNRRNSVPLATNHRFTCTAEVAHYINSTSSGRSSLSFLVFRHLVSPSVSCVLYDFVELFLGWNNKSRTAVSMLALQFPQPWPRSLLNGTAIFADCLL